MSEFQVDEDHNERIARLTELAREVWPSAPDEDPLELRIHVHEGSACVATSDGICLFVVVNHPRALAALEAALCVLAKKPPQWAVELAEKWNGWAEELDERAKTDANVSGYADGLTQCANELLAVAKGGNS